MGHEELIASLFKEADERKEAMWEEARSEAERVRREGTEKLKRLEQEVSGSRPRAEVEEAGKVLVEADEEARAIRLSAEHELSGRLRQAAREVLPSLGQGDRRRIFLALARELPPFEWRRVRVNPEDFETAGEAFPDAEIVAGESIAGGLVAETGDGKVSVVNTFQKRLERAWPELLPALIKSAEEAVTHHADP
jgi:V/A-type H+-transporting ATPase subunit E